VEIAAVDELTLASTVASDIDHAVGAPMTSDSLAAANAEAVVSAAAPAKTPGGAVFVDAIQVAAADETAAAAQDEAEVKTSASVDQSVEIAAVDELTLASTVASDIDHAVGAPMTSDSLAAANAEAVVSAAAGDAHPDVTLALYDFICGKRA
jgi:hypothetical protein